MQECNQDTRETDDSKLLLAKFAGKFALNFQMKPMIGVIYMASRKSLELHILHFNSLSNSCIQLLIS